MKKIKFLLILVVLILTGCSNKSIDKGDNSDQNNTKIDNYLGIKVESKNEIKCDYLIDVKYMSTQLFVTNNNQIYEYGIDKLYSNDQNCHQLGVNPRYNYLDNLKLGQIVGLRISEMIDDKKQQISYMPEVDNGNVAITGEFVTELKGVSEFYLSYPHIIERKNNVFNVIIYNGLPITKKDMQSEIAENEIIRYVNGGIIKTDKSYYLIKSTINNKEECEKYDDIKCEYNYNIIRNDLLNSINDKIVIAFNNGYENEDIIYIYAKNGFIYTININ